MLELDVESALASTETDRHEATQLIRPLGVDCDREVARFGAWYELFPRSGAASPASRSCCPS